MDDKAAVYNQFFSEHPRITVTVPFEAEEHFTGGQIEVATDKSPLLFDVKIPPGYPLSKNRGSIHFYCLSVTGYEHQNYDGSICLHPQPDHRILSKLEAELNLLFEWIQDYYIDEKSDPNYSYLLIPKNEVCLLFDDVDTQFTQHQTGQFTFTSLGRDKNTGVEHMILCNIGGQSGDFAKLFQEPKKEHSGQGLWVYIKDEPVIQRKEPAKSWLDLQPYFTDDTVNEVYKFGRWIKGRKGKQKHFFLMLGHDIPTPSGTEIHWELIRVPVNDLPIETFKEGGKYIGQFTDQKIDWCDTINCSYDRFFGRGRLHDSITQSNILLIGIGAIGSSLAKVLVRGGVKNLTIIDFDKVEAGNLCRSEYDLRDIKDDKIFSLGSKLVAISPFLNIHTYPGIDKCLPGSSYYPTIKEFVNRFDIIFDCTTDMEVAYMLDKMKPDCEIFNLSITNEARELVCVTGKSTITKNKSRIFEKLSPESKQADFYPEAGCQYPTFKASYNDINVLLNYAVKNINHKYEKDHSQSTFVLRTDDSGTSFNIQVDEF